MGKIRNRFMMVCLRSYDSTLETFAEIINDKNLTYAAVGLYIIMHEKLQRLGMGAELKTIYEWFHNEKDRLSIIDNLFLLHDNGHVIFDFRTDFDNPETENDFWIAERASLSMEAKGCTAMRAGKCD